MGIMLRNELSAPKTPPKLSLCTLPSHKPLSSEPPGMLTPPLQPMVSIPFQWEEAPGHPKYMPTKSPSPCRTKSAVRCLELPPRLSTEGNVVNLPPSPTTVLNGPRLGRSLSHRFWFEDVGPTAFMVTPTLDCDFGLDKGKCKNGLQVQFGSCRWASGGSGGADRKGTFVFPARVAESRNGDVNIKIKMTRFRRSKGSLHRLTHRSSRLLESIYGKIKQIMTRRH